LKILQINASYKPAYIYGGPTMSVSKLSEQLSKTSCYIEVFTTTANGNTELQVVPGAQVTIDNVPVTYFKRLTKDHSHFAPALLRNLWKQARNFDVIHIHAWWNLVSVLSCWIALKRKVPVVISPRGTLSVYSFTHKNSLPKRILHHCLGKRLLKRSFVHVTSEREWRAIENFVFPKQIIAVPNFVVLPGTVSEIKRQRPQHAPLKLLFFSRIEEKKGLDILLKALKSVTIPYHLTIAGDGHTDYTRKLKAIATSNGIADRLSWIGFQGANKFQLLQRHDLMILPSHDENFGNVVIESLSVGTAVLVSRYVGLADYVEGKDLGWICELDEKDISAHINSIFDQENKLNVIRQSAPHVIRRDFDEANLTEKYISMYNQVITNA
jgi:glycosyltransferase involved in cell wall biosynthesis